AFSKYSNSAVNYDYYGCRIYSGYNWNSLVADRPNYRLVSLAAFGLYNRGCGFFLEIELFLDRNKRIIGNFSGDRLFAHL
ncbi:MAG: hypothetical protein PHI73_05400, partial [Patescibacteria group bacterium]|nr:hypothetical protein [Patescibacteria group bacterium]